MSEINNLTIDNIHNIRHENYEKTKNLSFAELTGKTTENAQEFKKKLIKYQTDDVEMSLVAEPEMPYITKNENE